MCKFCNHWMVCFQAVGTSCLTKVIDNHTSQFAFVFHVFLGHFSRDFGARPAKIVSVVHALCLTAVFSWGNNELKGNVKTCISGERINLEFLSFCHYSSAVNDLFDANSVKTLNKWWRLEGCGFSFGELFSECQVR